MAENVDINTEELNFIFEAQGGGGQETQTLKEHFELFNIFNKASQHILGSLENGVRFQVYGSTAEQLQCEKVGEIGDVDIMIFPSSNSLMIHHELIEYLPEHPLHVRIKGVDHPVLKSCLVDDTEYVATAALKTFHPTIFPDRSELQKELEVIRSILPLHWHITNQVTSPAATLDLGRWLSFPENLPKIFRFITEATDFTKENVPSEHQIGLQMETKGNTSIETKVTDAKKEQLKAKVQAKIDFVPAFRSRGWPMVAREWIERERKWPSLDVVEKVIHEGFHLVVKPPKNGGNPVCDFRISFSHAEYLLSQEMNKVQRECYICLKKYHAAFLASNPKGLVTFHLKNLFLETVEETGAEMWTESNRTECMMKLFGKLLDALRQKKLPHFFVRSYNLFCIDYIESSEILESLAEKVEQIIASPMQFAKKLILAEGSKYSLRIKEASRNPASDQVMEEQSLSTKKEELLPTTATDRQRRVSITRLTELIKIAFSVTDPSQLEGLDPLERSLAEDLREIGRAYNIPGSEGYGTSNELVIAFLSLMVHTVQRSIRPNARRRILDEVPGLIRIVKYLVKQPDAPVAQENGTDVENASAGMLGRTLHPTPVGPLDPRELFRRIVQEHRDIDWGLFLGQRTAEQQKADMDDDIPLD